MLKKNKLKTYLPYILILPMVSLIGLFKIYPIISTVSESFLDKSSFSLINYRRIFNDSTFWKSLWITVKMNIVLTPLQIFLAIILGLLINKSIRGIAIIRTILYLPVTISLTVATIIWNIMLNPNSGVINSILIFLGFKGQPFFTSSKQALWCIILIATWKGVGYWMMFILAGLKDIDISLYESAKIDGANRWHLIKDITLPLLKRVLLFITIANTTINLLLFAPIHMVTQGGPQMSTNVLMYEAYKSSFLYVDRGRAAAIITILLIIIATVTSIQMKLIKAD